MLAGTPAPADVAAAVIAAAAGLPPPAPRKPRVSHAIALIAIPLGVALLALGITHPASGQPGLQALYTELRIWGAIFAVTALLAELGRFHARRRD